MKGAALGTILGLGLAFLLGAGAAIHLSTSAEHGSLFRAAFLSMAAFQAVWAVLVLRRPSRGVLRLAIAGQGAIVATWCVAHSVGLPFGPGAGEPEASGLKDMTATALEVLSIGVALGLLWGGERIREMRVAVSRPALGAVAVAALTWAAIATPHAHGPHSDDGHDALAHGGGEHADADAGEHGHGEPHSAEHAPGAAGHGAHTASTGARDGHGGGHGAGGILRAAVGHSGTGHGGGGSAVGHTGGGHTQDGDGGGEHTGDGGHDREHATGERGGGGHGGGGGRHETGGGHSGGGGHPGDDHGAPGTSGGTRPAGIYWQEGTASLGPALLLRGANAPDGGHHASSGSCSPTDEQRSAADRLYRETSAELKKYENNPARALADGFTYVIGPTDRIIHMVNLQRTRDRTILAAPQIESFLYSMTDRGLMPIGGMFIMPDTETPGPRFGGCMTQWHYHAGGSGRLVTLGTAERTAEMLHVWTYPGLEPYGHYGGRELSQLWGPGKLVPSVCWESSDATSNACVP